MYRILKDKAEPQYANFLPEALKCAEARFAALGPEEAATISIWSPQGTLVGALSTRPIVGTFTKQQWGGRRGDDALFVDEENFDATDTVLLLEHDELLKLQDRRASTDKIGEEHLNWDGPFEVSITESICEYFGVDRLWEITPEALWYVKARVMPKRPQEKLLTLNIQVRVRTTDGASLTEFLENLDHSVKSNTPGVIVRSTELIDADFH